ncbi:MAG: hypothetical protein WCI48_12270 [Bacteroidota bacterium]|jgi:hypothetical protein
MRNLILFALSLIFSPVVLEAQQINEGKETEAARIEIPSKTDQESYRAMACGTAGAMIFFKSVENADALHVKWYFSWYNKDLKQVWVKSFPLLTDLDYRFSLITRDTLCLVFVYKGKQKSEDQPLEIIRIALSHGSFIPNLSRVPANTEPVFFQVAGRNAFLALNQKSGQAAVEILDLKSNHTKGFLVDQQVPSLFQWFKTDSVTSGLKAIVTKMISKKEAEHWYEVFDTTGKVRLAVKLSTINDDREFTGFRAVPNGRGDDLVIGTYRLKGGSSQKNKEQDESTGIFTSLITSGVQKNLNFYNFLELKNINAFLSTKDLMDLKKKALKKNKNIGEYSVDFSVSNDEPIEKDGNFMLVTEVFYHQYHVENFTDFDFYGRPFTNSYSVFDGYRFTGAMVTSYNQEGQMLWDNALEIRDLVAADLSPKVVTHRLGDKFLLAYSAVGKIGSKIIRNEEVTGNLEFSKLESRYPDDKLVAETRSGITPWYDQYFLCYGFQEIKNVALESNNKRFIFYLTKVKFEE